MKWEKWYSGIIVVVLIGLVIGIWAAVRGSESKTATQTEEKPQIAGTQANSEKYFSDTAKVKYFYSPSCHWCQEEAKVLEKLSEQGYKVRPMDVNNDPARQEFVDAGFSGTPSFLGPDSQKKVGYQDEGELKAFLEKYK